LWLSKQAWTEENPRKNDGIAEKEKEGSTF
jgi:hypothetical protein